MPMIYHATAVKQVEILEGYRLLLTFDNGEKRVFDVEPLLTFGKFRELASPSLFRTVRVSFDTIAWSNGLDLDPEYLYEHSKTFSAEPIASL